MKQNSLAQRLEGERSRLEGLAGRLACDLESMARQKEDLVNDMIHLTTRLGQEEITAQNLDELERENSQL
jgi:hypothetical protein